MFVREAKGARPATTEADFDLHTEVFREAVSELAART